jgi:hypothetical protein
MDETKTRPVAIDERPDRIAHRRKVAMRIALDQPEFAANDPSRNAKVPEGGYISLHLARPDRGPHN